VISYRTGNDVDLDEFIAVYFDAKLSERRPADDRERMKTMLEEANLVITAWDSDRMIGISRSSTDFAYCTYLSDLAVDLDYQGQGIGKELIRLTQEAAPKAMLILLAAPAARDYYPHIGMNGHDSAWVLFPGDELT